MPTQNLHFQIQGTKAIPDILKNLENRTYLFTLDLTEENIKQGSQIYKASSISQSFELSDSHSPNNIQTVHVPQTQMSNVSV